MLFIQAKNFTPASHVRTIQLIVIHTMEAAEKPGTALAVARWFASDTAPRASAHYCVDDRETIRCVDDRDVAWGAPGANETGVHIEHAGFARQIARDWVDAYSQAMLLRSAALCAALCRRHDIPPIRRSASELIAGERGICGHSDVTEAFKRSTHWDPGEDFPWAQYLGLVSVALQGREPMLSRQLQLAQPRLNGPDVIMGQALLIASGYRLEVDGVYGPQTTAQVMAFQLSSALVVDGIVGPRTAARLRARLSTIVDELGSADTGR